LISFEFFLAPPKIIDITVESSNNDFIKENDQVILKCSARGTPQPRISWHTFGKKIPSNKRNDRSNSEEEEKT